jgi:oligopeptide transport system permease protein
LGGKVGETVTLEAHPLGTDYLGRDMLARLMYGARISMFIGIVAPILFVIFGTIYGGFAGFLGGKIDRYLMAFFRFRGGSAFLLFMILFKIAFGIGPGESGVIPMLIALVMLSWPGDITSGARAGHAAAG